jgi:hypothetical protein
VGENQLDGLPGYPTMETGCFFTRTSPETVSDDSTDYKVLYAPTTHGEIVSSPHYEVWHEKGERFWNGRGMGSDYQPSKVLMVWVTQEVPPLNTDTTPRLKGTIKADVEPGREWPYYKKVYIGRAKQLNKRNEPTDA